MLGCISPETGGFGSGSFGWFFPATLKYAGFDVVIVKGRSETPCYVFIDDKRIAFREASHLWGKETGETVKAIREELAERYEGEVRVLSTSVAGENLVRYAVPCADGTSCPGRTGAGAVMGSKNLKAVAVRGTGEIAIDDPRGLLESSYSAVKRFFENEPFLKVWQEGGASTALGTTGSWALNGSMLAENRNAADFPHLKNVGCLNCHNPCYHWLQIKEGKHAGLRQLGGHMTFMTAVLRNLEIQDFGDWIYFERLMQELGLDPASFSVSLSWAVDLFEKGILTEKDTDGLTLRRGDADLVARIAQRVAHREGSFAGLLADGIAEAGRKIGRGSEGMAPHVKGKPSLLKDPKIQALIWSLGALTSPRGGDWLRLHNVYELAFVPEKTDNYPKFIDRTCEELYEQTVRLVDIPEELKKKIFGDPPKIDMVWVKSTKDKALFAAWTEDFVSLFNSLVTCMFGAATQFLMVGFGPTTYSEILRKITGWDMPYEELMEVGERVFNLQRLFNYRLKGWDSAQDTWGDKRAYEPARMGIFKGNPVPWDEVLQDYYAVRGWSPRGIPTRAKLSRLKLQTMIGELEIPD
jgi:aldehyde:ferredoxin oxidoreductase